MVYKNAGQNFLFIFTTRNSVYGVKKHTLNIMEKTMTHSPLHSESITYVIVYKFSVGLAHPDARQSPEALKFILKIGAPRDHANSKNYIN